MIGLTVSHYRIISTLGEGGMGVVYLGEDMHLHRQVAIKFPSCAPDQDLARRRFIGEARHASRLTHPHIAAIYDYGEAEDGCPFIVMELVRGESLADVIARGSLTLGRAVEVAIQTAEALEEAHTHGIVHRDIKPANIRFTKSGSIKVLDFGLAKNFDTGAGAPADAHAATIQTAHTESGLLIGTPLYLSPEQFKGAQADARSDLFALGALLYECIAGRPAFSGANFVEIGAQVIHVEPPPLARFAPAVPPELERIMRRLLAKNPAERYQSASEAITDLRHIRRLLANNAALARTQPLTSNGHSLSSEANASGAGASSLLTLLSANSDIAPTRDGTPAKTTPLADRHSITEHGSLVARTLEMFQRNWERRLSAPHAIALALGAAALAILLVWLVLFAWRNDEASHVPPAEAVKFYEIGVASLRDGAPYGASKALQRAVTTDLQFALAHARLAEAWTELDSSDRARDALLRVGALVPDRSALPRPEALRLEAVLALATREYARAVTAFREIAKIEPKDARVRVDLGRALEKADDTPGALAAYMEAARLDPEYATAHLRSGVLHGRLQETDKALAAFARAETIYEVLNNIEGRAEVFYQRGVLFDRVGRIAEARGELQRALDLARATANQYQQVSTLLQLSGILYSEGDTERAESVAREATELARAGGMETLTARGFTDIGIVFFVQGKYEEAESHLRQAIIFAERSGARASQARALFTLGSLRSQQGRSDEALDLVQRSLAFYENGNYRKEAAQCLVLIGRVKRQRGDYQAAREAFAQQLQLAEATGDITLQALAHSELGSVLASQERYGEALRHFERRHELAKEMNDQLRIGYSLMDRASMEWRLGRYTEAKQSLDEASSIAGQPLSQYKILLASVHLQRAYLHLSERRFNEARAEASRAIALAGTEYDETVVEAKGILGASQTFSGATREGVGRCQEAVELAVKSDDPRLISTAMLMLAEAALTAGETSRARETALRALRFFGDAGRRDSEWRAWAVAKQAAERVGDETAARDYAGRATSAFAEMKQRLEPKDYASYLARPDVQAAVNRFENRLQTASNIPR